jgi:divinyl chlorophyllide a 8-vinyl-reductase
MLLGATGTIGRAAASALAERGHDVVAVVRNATAERTLPELSRSECRVADVTDPGSLARDGFRHDRFDVLVSCLASRTGEPRDAWRIDHRAHVDALDLARRAGVTQVVLLSAICVQKPRLAFQHAKLAFEAVLRQSDLLFSIVRPTAYFKSLSGQVERVRAGKPYLVFGDGTLTACKPISDRDLGAYIAECLDDETRLNRILPIGGPGPAITPRRQGEMLFELLGRTPRYTRVPVAMLDAVAAVTAPLGWIVPSLATKAELARIGRYYATESMLVLDPHTGRYDADATPSTGTETLRDHYAALLRGERTADLGEHAVF